MASLAAVPASIRQEPPRRTAVFVNLSPFTQGTVRRALDLALASLASPDCPLVYSDFELEDGKTPQDELDRLGVGPGEFLETLVFLDGSREPVCRAGRAALITQPGNRAIWVCPLFVGLQTRSPRLAVSLIIHESLHCLGLGEDPPSSSEITRAVQRRCWRLGRGATP